MYTTCIRIYVYTKAQSDNLRGTHPRGHLRLRRCFPFYLLSIESGIQPFRLRVSRVPTIIRGDRNKNGKKNKNKKKEKRRK